MLDFLEAAIQKSIEDPDAAVPAQIELRIEGKTSATTVIWRRLDEVGESVGVQIFGPHRKPRKNLSVTETEVSELVQDFEFLRDLAGITRWSGFVTSRTIYGEKITALADWIADRDVSRWIE